MSAQRILFLGNKDIGYECLLELVSRQHELNIQCVGVLSQNKGSITGKKANIIALAEEHHIPVLTSLDDLEQIPNIDYLISVQYHLILQQKHIRFAQKLCVNLHMAPLPDYRGCNQFSFAILDGATEFGTTIHVLDEGIDSGDILWEDRFPISQTISVQELYDVTYQKSVALFKKALPLLVQDQYSRIPQKTFVGKRPANFHLRNEMDQIKCIELSWPKEKIETYIRATYFPPFDPPFAWLDGKKIDITPEWIKKNR